MKILVQTGGLYSNSYLYNPLQGAISRSSDWPKIVTTTATYVGP